MIVSSKLGPILDRSGVKAGELGRGELLDGIARMDNELDKRIADLSADIVLEIDQTWLLAIESRRGAFERLGKHGDVGPAVNEISRAVGGTARQDCLDVCPSRACEKKHQNGKRRCTRSFAEYGHSVMQSRWRRRRHVNSHESYPMKTIDEA